MILYSKNKYLHIQLSFYKSLRNSCREKAKFQNRSIVMFGTVPFNIYLVVICLVVNGLVVKVLDPLSRCHVLKTTGWLQGRLSLSSF